MSIGIYYPHFLDFGGSSGGVARFDSVSMDPQYEMIARSGGGDPFPCFVGAASAEPTIRFTTPSLKEVLLACPDFNVVGDLQPDDVILSWRKGKPQSMREDLADLVHVQSILNNSAMLYWDSISATESQDATISATLMAARNQGSQEDPWQNIGSVGLGTSKCEGIYTMGPVFFNGRLLGSIHDLNWNNNMRPYSRKTGLSPKDPCYQSIHDHRPVITLKSNDLLENMHENPVLTPGLDTYGGQQMDKLEVYFRKRKRTGFYEDDFTSEHIKLSCLGGWKAGTSIDGQEPAEGTIEFHCSQAVDGLGNVSNAPLINRDVASPIPAYNVAPELETVPTQNQNDGDEIFLQNAITATSGSPTVWAATGLPTGVAMNVNSGLMSGTINDAAATYGVTVDASNTVGASAPSNFDMVVT